MNSISNEKYSGWNENDENIDLDNWTPLNADLIQKMVSQIEYYLSDENLAQDAFLLKHVRRNKMGYVNIKLLISFKKIKQFKQDWRVTAYALRHLLKLEVNKEGNKVCRIEPVPESVLFQVPSRLLQVWNITELNLTDDKTHDTPALCKSTLETAIVILKPFGTITMARVNRPGRALLPELQKYLYRYPELLTEESVLVEYEDLEGAGLAYHQLSEFESNIRVLLVGKAPKKKAVEVGLKNKSNRKGIAVLKQQMLQLQSRDEDSSACSSSESEFASPSPLTTPRVFSGQVHSRTLGNRHSRLRCVQAPMQGPHISPLLASEVWSSPDASPEFLEKHKLYTNQNKHLSQLSEKRQLNGDTAPPRVICLPYGPDGSKGFHARVS